MCILLLPLRQQTHGLVPPRRSRADSQLMGKLLCGSHSAEWQCLHLLWGCMEVSSFMCPLGIIRTCHAYNSSM